MDAADVYKAIRNEILQEYNLAASRLGWLLTSQVFLFSALILGIKEGGRYVGLGMLKKIDYIHIYSIYHPILELFGLIVSATVLFGVWGAFLRIAAWEAQKNIYLSTKKDEICKCSMRGGGYLIHWFGMLPGLIIPSLSVVVWIVMLMNYEAVNYIVLMFNIKDASYVNYIGAIVVPAVFVAYVIFLSIVSMENIFCYFNMRIVLVSYVLSSSVYVCCVCLFGVPVCSCLIQTLLSTVVSLVISCLAMVGWGAVEGCNMRNCFKSSQSVACKSNRSAISKGRRSVTPGRCTVLSVRGLVRRLFAFVE